MVVLGVHKGQLGHTFQLIVKRLFSLLQHDYELILKKIPLSFTIIFDDYVASIGPGVDITQNRKNCQLNLDLEYPAGFQYSVFDTVYRGYVGISAGVTATQSAVFYYSGRKSFPILQQITLNHIPRNRPGNHRHEFYWTPFARLRS